MKAGSCRSRRATATMMLAGSAVLGALSVALDYIQLASGTKALMSTPWALAFPQAWFLKFDFTGVPIFCAMAFFGLGSGAVVSFIVGVFIMLRKTWVDGTMKALAEFSTILGTYLGLRMWGEKRRRISLSLGPISRAVFMCLANLVVTPFYLQQPIEFVVALLPLIALFNLIQGTITVGVGFLAVKAVVKRAPHVVPEGAPALAWLEAGR